MLLVMAVSLEAAVGDETSWVIYGVLMWAYMNAATPPSRGRGGALRFPRPPKTCADYSGKGKWSACKAQGCSFDLTTKVCTKNPIGCALHSGKGKYRKCKAQPGCKFDLSTKVCASV